MKFRLVEEFVFDEDIAVLDRTSNDARNTKTIRYVVQAVPVDSTVSKQTIVTKFSELPAVIKRYSKTKFRFCYVHTQQYDSGERTYVDINDSVTITPRKRSWDISRLNSIKNKVEN